MKILKITTNSILASVFTLLITSCASTKLTIKSKELAMLEIEKPILIIPPLTEDLSLLKTADTLGTAFSAEIPKLINGQVVYAKDIKTLQKSLTWDNLVKNGAINIDECVTIAKTVGCSSIFVSRIIEFKKYPPFRMVLNMKWIDVETGDILAKAYNNVDLMDYETEHKFATFAGHGPVKRTYEQFNYSSELKHTASLSPSKFSQYVAAHSTQMMFGDLFEVKWYKFWNIL